MPTTTPETIQLTIEARHILPGDVLPSHVARVQNTRWHSVDGERFVEVTPTSGKAFSLRLEETVTVQREARKRR